MSSKKWIFLILLVPLLALIAIVSLQRDRPSDWFVEYPFPLKEDHKLFDMGVMDVNQDGLLDVYTSNHNFRQSLRIADGLGGYHDALDEWGLSQNREFPGLEISYTAPVVDEPGLYIYWLGSGGNDEQGHNVIIRAHKIAKIRQWQGTLQIYAPVEIANNDGFDVEIQPQSSRWSETTVNFSATGDALLALKFTTWGLPLDFSFEGALQPSQIIVGNQKVLPGSTSFSLALQDRHGHAWADYNNDGKLDLFVTRGALGGHLKDLPENVSNTIKDEFLVSQNGGEYKEQARELGIIKEGCSSRHTKWTDFNQDGLLDLYINCQDRGKIKEPFPKQLYRQTAKGSFVKAAAEVGLDIPDHQLIDFVWLDADNDGDVDLLTNEDKGYFLYRNQSGQFLPEFIGRGEFARADRPKLKFNTYDYWIFDGKLTVADYDADGDLDAFAASKKGNMLLINNDGEYSLVDPASVGLPPKSVVASWVDYDNDGLVDLHTVPEGLFHQRKEHGFDATKLLVLPSRKYMAAISNWADLDNDGDRDVLIALNENPSLWRWWEKPFKVPEDSFRWELLTYRNVDARNHWLQIKLIGADGNRQAIGSRVTVVTPDGLQAQEVGASEGAFFSQGHYRLYFGVGSNQRVDAIKIRWSDGHQQELKDVGVDSLLVVERNNPS